MSSPRRTSQRCLALLLVAACLGFGGVVAATPSGASRDRLALLLGDSLTSETKPVYVAPPGWRLEFLAYPGIAPCDWLRGSTLRRLLNRHPSLVLVETASNDYTACMRVDGTLPVLGDAAFLRRYEQSLTTVFQDAHRVHATVVYLDPPMFFEPAVQRASIALDRWARSKVRVSGAPRWAVTVDGKPVVYMHCLASETAADGCLFGQIPVRTVDELGHVHFCPHHADFTAVYTCSVYSSGEHRWARAVDRLIRSTH